MKTRMVAALAAAAFAASAFAADKIRVGLISTLSGPSAAQADIPIRVPMNRPVRSARRMVTQSLTSGLNLDARPGFRASGLVGQARNRVKTRAGRVRPP